MAANTRRSSRTATKASEPESASGASDAAATTTSTTIAVASSDKRTSKKAKAAAAASDPVSKATNKKKSKDAPTPSTAKGQRATKPPNQSASKKRPADTTLTQDASANNNNNKNNSNSSADDFTTKPTKRRRKSKADNSSSGDTSTTTTTMTSGPSSATQEKVAVDPSDPCSMLPTEIWHKVLSHLPLSQVAKTSWVSKTWLDGARKWPVWQQICEKCKLGTPKIKYKTFMAIVCANSYFICDKCHSHSTGSGSFVRRSEIPLKVKVVIKAGRPPKETTNAEEGEKNKDSAGPSGSSAGFAGSAETTKSGSAAQAEGSEADRTLGAPTEQGQDSAQSSTLLGPSQTQASTAVQSQSSCHEPPVQNQASVAEPTETTAQIQDHPQDKDSAEKAGADNDKIMVQHANTNQGQSQSQEGGQVVTQDKGKGKAEADLNDEVTEDWNLCLECRQEYYEDHPEPVDPSWPGMTGETQITKTNARDIYHLSEMDLCGIPYEEYDNPHYRYGAPMCLYDIDDVEREAQRVHGGWVGISAVGRETAKRRRAAFKARQAAFNPRRLSPKVVELRKKKRKLKMLIAAGKIVPGEKLLAALKMKKPTTATTATTAATTPRATSAGSLSA
ncbi:unnamed protein product [Mortierella alpina]